MTRLGGFGLPGVGSRDLTSHRELLWGGDDAAHKALYMGAYVSGATRDAGNTPTTILRDGLLMGKLTASGKLEEWDPAATDGTQNIAGILANELRAQDYDGNNADRWFRILVNGPIKASQILILGVAMVGHASEFQARRQLVDAGIILDDDPFGYLAGYGNRLLAKTADYAITDSDNGTLFTNTGAAGAVNFTLPATAKMGLEYQFFVTADQTVTLTSGTADTMIVYNDIAADSIALSTAGNKVGGAFRVVADGSKWLVFYMAGQTSDGTATGQRVTIVT